MLIQEYKSIVIRKDGKAISFTVPLDFEVTDEYIKEKINNPELTKCEEWLNLNGFIKETRGWSYYGNNIGNGKIRITIPDFFINRDFNNFYVKFHRIENAATFSIPIITEAKNEVWDEHYNTLNNFPDYISPETNIVLWSLSMEEKDFYREKSRTGLMLQESNYKIDDHLLYFMVKNKFQIKPFNKNRFNPEIIKELDRDIYNELTSLKGIKKFNL